MAKMNFSHKVVLLTGASGGIGAGIARRLSEQGARLVASGRSAGDLKKLIRELPHPEQAVAIEADLGKPGEASKLAARALETAGRVDVLINNAGLGYFALVEEADEERMRHLFEVNTFSPLLLAQALVPQMKRRGGGRIVNVVSCAGRVPIPSVGVYGGSKSALAMIANPIPVSHGDCSWRNISRLASRSRRALRYSPHISYVLPNCTSDWPSRCLSPMCSLICRAFSKNSIASGTLPSSLPIIPAPHIALA